MKIIVNFILFQIIFLSFCGEQKIQSDKKIIAPKFHTIENEGYWKNKSETHLPVITFLSNTKIKVYVPLKQTKTPRHYIEAIVLMKGKKEIAKKTFKFSYQQPEVIFDLKEADAKDYWVVAKCNLHDMWKEIVKKDD